MNQIKKMKTRKWKRVNRYGKIKVWVLKVGIIEKNNIKTKRKQKGKKYRIIVGISV